MLAEMQNISTGVAYTAATITGVLDTYGEIIPRELENQKEEINMCEKVREVLEANNLHD